MPPTVLVSPVMERVAVVADVPVDLTSAPAVMPTPAWLSYSPVPISWMDPVEASTSVEASLRRMPSLNWLPPLRRRR
ncbi:MAG: hypothetical protein R3F31_25380 [Verrucomicrobiales bacterium]